MERCAQLFAEGDLDKDGKARVAAPLCRVLRRAVPLRVLTRGLRSCLTTASSSSSTSSQTTTRSRCARCSTATTAGRSASESAPRAPAAPRPRAPDAARRFIYNLAKFNDESCVPCHAVAPV